MAVALLELGGVATEMGELGSGEGAAKGTGRGTVEGGAAQEGGLCRYRYGTSEATCGAESGVVGESSWER